MIWEGYKIEVVGISWTSIKNCIVEQICLQLRPNFADAWSNLASAYMRKGRFTEAAQCCRQALALNPRLVTFILGLSTVKSHLSIFSYLT